jgi:hypothetical protein
VTRPEPEFATGQAVVWIAPCLIVNVAHAHYEHYVMLPVPDGWLYDIADRATGRILLYGAAASELAALDATEAQS